MTVPATWHPWRPSTPEELGLTVQPPIPGIGGGSGGRDRFPVLPPGLKVYPDTQPAKQGGGTPGMGTGSDPLSTLAAAYMASLGGGASGTGATAPIVIPASANEGGGTSVNWAMVGALAAVALVVWAIYTWWKKKHGGTA